MNKEEIYSFLQNKEIPFEIMEHKAVYNMKELDEIEMPHSEAEAKNLFIRDDKKRNYYMLTVQGDKHVDLKKFQLEQETRRLSFASDTDLMNILGLTPGAVTPLGLLNDEQRIVNLYLDEDFLPGNGLVAVHPNDNTATVWLRCSDLIDIIKEHGNIVRTVKFPTL